MIDAISSVNWPMTQKTKKIAALTADREWSKTCNVNYYTITP